MNLETAYEKQSKILDKKTFNTTGHQEQYSLLKEIFEDFEKEKLYIAEKQLVLVNKYNDSVDKLVEFQNRTCENCVFLDSHGSGWLECDLRIDKVFEEISYSCGEWEAKS